MALTFDAALCLGLGGRIAFNTPNVLTGIRLGTMPLEARPKGIYVDVVTAFNNGASARLGFGVGANEWAAAIDLTTTGRKYAMNYVDIPAPLTSAREVWLRIDHGGTPPSAGLGNFIAEYLW